MRTSEQTDALVQALLAAQPELGKVTKTRKVEAGRQRYTYAELADVLEACRSTLHKHGILMVQSAELVNHGTPQRDHLAVGVVTRFWHSSGQWLEGQLFLPINDVTYWKDGEERTRPAGPQECGSAITYARRYALLPLLALAAEDDDGAAAQPASKARSRTKAAEPKPKPTTPQERAQRLQTAVEKFHERHGFSLTEVEAILGHPVTEGASDDDLARLAKVWKLVEEAAKAGDDVRGPVREYLELSDAL